MRTNLCALCFSEMMVHPLEGRKRSRVPAFCTIFLVISRQHSLSKYPSFPRTAFQIHLSGHLFLDRLNLTSLQGRSL
ncbi:hypothetical protein GOP47_0028204 [Adiantum capillus-veneris]|nr:hypothetical protein GOP47_0028204 [Adiantum capillus-veneris]